ncbi:MAG: B12-binding domain-containing radical SAM protein [Pyrinomonadaceae bacterium]
MGGEKSGNVVFVSSGMLAPKKQDNVLARKHLYLNYGLVGLASILNGKGYSAEVHHGNFVPPEAIASRLCACGSLETRYPLMLSIPSSFALSWAKRFCAAVKILKPGLKIVAGGKWAIGTDGDWVRRQIPQIDLVVYGDSERRIESLLYPERWTRVPHTSAAGAGGAEPPLKAFPHLDYGLMPDFSHYQPIIEVSRGCGLGCAFCLEKDVALGELLAPARIRDSLSRYYELYGSHALNSYFQSSFFRPTADWAAGLARIYEEWGLATRWRTETRVDSLTPRRLETLARAGLKILDLGLESASRGQLLAMQKTTRPEVYLKRASELLRACDSLGVWAKVNVLLYAGESEGTVEETVGWLDEHTDYIKGVSVNPLFVYRFGPESAMYVEGLRADGARPVDPAALERDGFASMHLSDAICFERSLEIASQVRRRFMSARDYYDLKSFSYFPRGFTYSDFLGACAMSDLGKLPFDYSLAPARAS